MNEPLVSVCIITYNHAAFIRQAIDSVLMQKHSYPWEIIIADDNSTDGTKEVIVGYQQKFPELIKPILRTQNIGAYKNWLELLLSAKGKYTAYLEGDDFWTDSNKIKEQTAFMAEHPQYVGCFHNSEERFENDDTKASFLYCNFDGAKDISFDDLSYTNLIPSCSMFFKTEVSHKIPLWFSELKMGDWPFHLGNSTMGKYRYLPRVMGVHRHHTASTWMLQSSEKTKQYVVDAYDLMIEQYKEQEDYQRQLIIAKASFLERPQKPSLIRRGINLVRRVKNKLAI